MAENSEVEIAAAARNAAELYFFGGSLAFGPGFLTHKDNFMPTVAYHFAEYERRTGRRIDLPPGMALAVGLGSVSWAIIKSDDRCKEQFDQMMDSVRKNISDNWMDRIPFLRIFRKQETAERVGEENHVA